MGAKGSLPLECLNDWFFGGKSMAKGGFTVNFLRKEMSARERKEHDDFYPFRFPPLK